MFIRNILKDVFIKNKISFSPIFFTDLFSSCHGSFITGDFPIVKKQDEPSKPRYLFCSCTHDGLQQSKPTCCHKHIRTDTNSKVSHRNLAKKSTDYLKLYRLTQIKRKNKNDASQCEPRYKSDSTKIYRGYYQLFACQKRFQQNVHTKNEPYWYQLFSCGGELLKKKGKDRKYKYM